MTQPTTDPLRNLADRAEHHGGLTGNEAARLRDGIDQLYADLDWWKRLAQDARATEAKRTTERDEQQQRAGQAEAALNAIRALHQPARDWSWQKFGCDHDGTHAQLCGRCRSCYPCPTIAALDAHTNPTDR